MKINTDKTFNELIFITSKHQLIKIYLKNNILFSVKTIKY